MDYHEVLEESIRSHGEWLVTISEYLRSSGAMTWPGNFGGEVRIVLKVTLE